MQQRLYWPPISDNVLRIVAVCSLAFLIELVGRIAGGFDSGRLLLRFDQGFHPLQIFAHVFALGRLGFLGGLLHLLFEALVLWMFGSELEREWGRHNFLRMFFWGLVGGVAAGALTSLFLPITLYGFGAGTAAVLVAYAMIWPDRQALLFFVLPVKMKWLVLIVFVFLFIGDFPNQFILQLGGALAGALFVYYHARRGRSQATGAAAGGAFAGAAADGPLDRIQEKLRKRRLAKKQAEIDRRIEMKAEVDRLLEKISTEGMQSLSRKEKRFLDQASKEL